MAGGLERAKVTTAGGSLAFGAVTGAFQTLVTSTNVRKLIIQNTLDKDGVVSLDGGTTSWHTLPAGKDLVLDFDISLVFNGTVQYKHNGVAPTAGIIAATVIRGQ